MAVDVVQTKVRHHVAGYEKATRHTVYMCACVWVRVCVHVRTCVRGCVGAHVCALVCEIDKKIAF